MPEFRNLIRALVGAALGVGLAACVVLPVPRDLPAIALEQAVLYRLELAMAVFYGCLLLATPAYSGLARGRLPIEISTRGAKFAAETDQTDARDAATIKQLEQSITDLNAGLAAANVEITRVKSQIPVTERD